MKVYQHRKQCFGTTVSVHFRFGCFAFWNHHGRTTLRFRWKHFVSPRFCRVLSIELVSVVPDWFQFFLTFFSFYLVSETPIVTSTRGPFESRSLTFTRTNARARVAVLSGMCCRSIRVRGVVAHCPAVKRVERYRLSTVHESDNEILFLNRSYWTLRRRINDRRRKINLGNSRNEQQLKQYQTFNELIFAIAL